MKKLLIIALLFGGCENSTEPEVHPLVGVWLAIEGTQTSSDGTVLDTIEFDETISMTHVFSEDGMLSSNFVSPDDGSESTTAIWSAAGNKLTIITQNPTQNPDNAGETTIFDYSISGTMLTLEWTESIDSDMNKIEVKFQKQ